MSAPPPIGPARPGKRRFKWPTISIDLSQPRHRRNLGLGMFGALIMLFGLAFSGYSIYTWTDSAGFCGSTCHPMEPQNVRYKFSDHSNVKCVDCHIGPGVSFFIRSKIDGIGQVFATVFNTYPAPIKSPVHNLRPARETCEECHTPRTFKDNIVKTVLRFDTDQSSTPIQSSLILKMGGYQPTAERSQGIHWHITNKVLYIADDEQRQVMTWVGVESADGTLKNFYARDKLTMANTQFVEEARASGEVREMDCIDCHNRAAHYIPTPQESVDDALRYGLLSRGVPYIRAKAIEVLTPLYATREAGYAAIDGLADFYRANFPDFAQASSVELQGALKEIKRIFDVTSFPAMQTNWATNPNNERHTTFPGCFRCHDGEHVSVDAAGREAEIISVECNLCHSVPIVGRGAVTRIDEGGNPIPDPHGLPIVEAPVIIGSVPPSHSDFRWTIEHRNITDADKKLCADCHGQAFCNNGVCHNVSHPPDMLFAHADEFKKQGGQICYICHQNNVTCNRCHPGGIVQNP